jgi:hypothetical protein
MVDNIYEKTPMNRGYGEIGMTKRSAKNQKSHPASATRQGEGPSRSPVAETRTKSSELVVVTFAENIEQARDFEILLKNNDIPTVVKEQKDPSNDSQGIAVMVPEDYLDEAHVVIESQSAYDDFYDFALEDEEEEETEYEDDMLDDNF